MSYPAPYLAGFYLLHLFRCLRDKSRIPQSTKQFLAKHVHNKKERIDSGFVLALENRLSRNKTQLEFTDLGSGKKVKRSVSDIFQSSRKRPKHLNLLFRLVKFLSPNTSVEVGTSLGMTSLALSMASTKPIHTFEGIEPIADIAQQNFQAAFKSNIQLHRGNFDDTLAKTLQELGDVEFYFLDGNHYYEPTMRYFDLALKHSNSSTCIVFDDINWSAEMQKAWREIVANPKVFLSLDLFYMGIVFLDPKYGEGHYSVLY